MRHETSTIEVHTRYSTTYTVECSCGEFTRRGFEYRTQADLAGRDHVRASFGPHDCDDHAVPYVSDGALGHGWECGLCGAFLQAG